MAEIVGADGLALPPLRILIRSAVGSCSQNQKKKGGCLSRPSRNYKMTPGNYRPAAAPAAFGTIPAIFIDSIRASTVSRLAPVSVQAST